MEKHNVTYYFHMKTSDCLLGLQTSPMEIIAQLGLHS